MGIWLYSGDGSGAQQSINAFHDTRFLSADSAAIAPLISLKPKCSSKYDLDLLFEDGILPIVIYALFVILATLRVLVLRGRKDFVTKNWFLRTGKLVSDHLICVKIQDFD